MEVRREPPALVKGLSHVGGQWPWSGSEAGVAGPGQHSPGGLGGAGGTEGQPGGEEGWRGLRNAGRLRRRERGLTRPDLAAAARAGPPGPVRRGGEAPALPRGRPRPLGAALCGTGPEPLPGAFLAACRPPRLSSTLPGARVTRSLPLPLSKGGVSPAQHRALSQRDGPPRWPAGPVLAKPTSQRGDRPEQTGRPDDLRAWEETRMTNKQRMDTWTPGEGGRGRCPTPGAVPSPPLPASRSCAEALLVPSPGQLRS